MIGQPGLADEASISSSIKSAAKSSHSESGKAGGEKKTKKTYGRPPPVSDCPLFVTEPKIISFTGYDANSVLTLPVHFRNVSAISRLLRVIPPATKYFALAPLKFPAHCKGGLVAPGMAVSSSITFYPDSLGDYCDQLHVETEGGSYIVQVVSTRDTPILNLPAVLNVGASLVGDAIRVAFQCLNTGGAGKFALFTKEFFHEANPVETQTVDWFCQTPIRAKPLTIYPVTFQLSRNQSVDLNVEYLPKQLEQNRLELVLISDNKQTWYFSVLAESRFVNISISEINTVALMNGASSDNSITDSAMNSSVSKDVSFEKCYVGSDNTQQVVVSNDTGLILEYEWVWVPAHTATKNLTKTARNKLEERIKADEENNIAQTILEDNVHFADDHMDSVGDAEIWRRNDESNNNNDRDEAADGARAASPSNIRTPEIRTAMLESLNVTKGFENTAVSKAFSVSPARGVLSIEGSGTFNFSYCPEDTARSAFRAVLLLRSIPLASIPDGDQAKYLSDLSAIGHGEYVKLRSWLETIGEDAKVPKYKKINGDSTNMAKLISLKKIVDMASSYAAPEVDVLIYGRFVSWVNKAIEHFAAFKNNTLVEEDTPTQSHAVLGVDGDIDGEMLAGPPPTVIVLLQDWHGRPGRANSIPALKLKVEIELPPVDPVSSASVDQSTKSRKKRFPSAGGDDDLSLTSVETVSTAPVVESMWQRTGKTEEQWLETVFLDTPNALLLLGPDICKCLDAKIEHEAVEYIQSCVRSNVVGLSLEVSGESLAPSVSLYPPELSVGGILCGGKRWTGSFKIQNNSSIMIEVWVDTSGILVIPLDADCALPQPLRYSIEFDQPRVLLMSETAVTMNVSFCMSAIGRFKAVIPFVTTNKYTRVESLTLYVNLSSPRVRFESPELDIGLISVSGSKSKTLLFTNESDVSVRYALKTILDTEGILQLKFLGSPKGKKNNSDSRPSTSRSTFDSARTQDSEGGDGKDDGDPKYARCLIDPSSGEIGPGQTTSVNVVCRAGHGPQRVRGVVECALTDAAGLLKLPTQHISLRAEIQAPKTILYPMQIDVGSVYVGVPIDFEFTIENVANLPSNYKIERPGGPSKAYQLNFSSTKGDLASKQIVVIKGTLRTMQVCTIDEIYAVKVLGLGMPLAFTLKGISKGISVEILPLPPGADVPQPLAPPNAPQFPGQGAVPEASELVPLSMCEEGKTTVALYQRRERRFVMRNLSAIAIPFDFTISKYKASAGDRGKPRKSASRQMKAIENVEELEFEAKKQAQQFLLVPHEDGEDRFQSVAGKAYIGGRVQRLEDKKYLALGLGASYIGEPRMGTLPPWGVVVGTIRSFNDSPGDYDDWLQCSINTQILPGIKMNIPIKMSVEGCPILIEKDALGMTVCRDRENKTCYNKQLLHMGYGCVGCDPLVREFFVRNNGASAGLIRWKLADAKKPPIGPVKVSLVLEPVEATDSASTTQKKSVKGGVRVKTAIKFLDEIENLSPFLIEPVECEIPPYSRQKFVVTLTKTSDVANEMARLTASISTEAEKVPGSESTKSGKNNFTLTLLAESDVMYPELRLDKNRFTATQAITLVEASRGIKLKTQAPVLFSKMGSAAASSADGFMRTILLENPLPVSMVMSVSTVGPFKIKDAGSSDDSNSTGSRDHTMTSIISASVQPGSVSSHLAPRGAGKGSSIGKTFRLLPQETATFAVVFTPKRDLRDTMYSTSSVEASKPREEEGKLVVSFSTGQSLQIPVKVLLEIPFISASAPRLYFGCCNTEQSCSGTILLSNPTKVPASWSVSPVLGAPRKVSSIRVKGFEEKAEQMDDPTVWEISPDSGVLDGPTVSVTAATACPPKDLNRQLEGIVVPQRLVAASWATQTLTLTDALEQRHNNQHSFVADANYPLPVTIFFRPVRNVRYSSRFRFSCEFGNTFDILLEGEGTYEENLHKPLYPKPGPTR